MRKLLVLLFPLLLSATPHYGWTADQTIQRMFRGAFATMFFGTNYTSGGGAGTITMVQFSVAALPDTANGTVSITLSPSTSSGDQIFVLADNTATLNSFPAGPVTDSGSQTYTCDWSNITFTSAHKVIFCRVLASAAGVTSVTVQESSSSGAGGVWVWHTNNAGSGIDTNAQPSGSTASPWSSTGINTAQAAEIGFGLSDGVFNGVNCAMSVSGGWSGGSGGTTTPLASTGNWDNGNGGQGMAAYQIWSTTQTGVQYTGTDSGTCNHFVGILAFKK